MYCLKIKLMKKVLMNLINLKYFSWEIYFDSLQNLIKSFFRDILMIKIRSSVLKFFYNMRDISVNKSIFVLFLLEIGKKNSLKIKLET